MFHDHVIVGFMKQYIRITCRRCSEDDLVKNGHSRNGTQRYLCRRCGKSFQAEYSYNAWLPGIKEQIETQTLNSSGGQRYKQKSRNLKKHSDFRTQKKTPAEVNPYFMPDNGIFSGLEIEIRTDAEADEFQSYVGNWGNQRWTWYAIERKAV